MLAIGEPLLSPHYCTQERISNKPDIRKGWHAAWMGMNAYFERTWNFGRHSPMMHTSRTKERCTWSVEGLGVPVMKVVREGEVAMDDAREIGQIGRAHV